MRSSVLARCQPSPIPTVHVLPEYLADGERKRWYDEAKAALQVPWTGVVLMAYAHYPNFFAALWEGLRPIVHSSAFGAHCLELREMVELEVMALEPPDLNAPLREMGYAPRELAQIAQLLEVFSHGNFPYLLIATLTRLLLEGLELEGEREADAAQLVGRPALGAQGPLVLMEPHHADMPTRAVYTDIQETLGLPFVNTDYRALARWPTYFALAWSSLRPVVSGPVHEAVCESVHAIVVEQVHRNLPNPAGLMAGALRAAAERDAPLAEVLGVARLFQWLLPGLVTNIAFLRAQLLAS